MEKDVKEKYVKSFFKKLSKDVKEGEKCKNT